MVRAFLVLIVILVILGIFAMMRNSWNRRVKSGSDIPPLAPVPTPFDVSQSVDQATYLGTMSEAHWLDRVAAQGLGSRGPASIDCGEAGLAIDRVGTDTLFIPMGAITLVSLERGLAGRVYGPEGVLCVRWTWGPRTLTTGLRIPDEKARTALNTFLAESLPHNPGAAGAAPQQAQGEASA